MYLLGALEARHTICGRGSVAFEHRLSSVILPTRQHRVENSLHLRSGIHI